MIVLHRIIRSPTAYPLKWLMSRLISAQMWTGIRSISVSPSTLTLKLIRDYSWTTQIHRHGFCTHVFIRFLANILVCGTPYKMLLQNFGAPIPTDVMFVDSLNAFS